MDRTSAAPQEQLRALAVVLTAVRGRLDELSSHLPDEEPGLAGEGGPGLRSVIACVLTDSIEPAIRDLLSAAEPEPTPSAALASAASAVPEGGEYAGLWSRLDGRLSRLLAEGESERRQAEALFAELAPLGGGERCRAIAAPRFHRLILVDRLLEGAQAALPADPAAAADLAAAAGEVAGRLAEADESMAGRARAACWLAHARRMGGDEAGAEQALAEAALYAVRADERARLCRALALLRWEQGRLDEAAALLERAAERWAGEESPHEEGACRVLRALLSIDEGKVRDAVRPLRQGLPLLVDPWLTLYGGLALALGLSELGLAARARAQRDESAALVHLSPPAAYLFARRLEGEVALSLGEHGAAEGMLEELRREALAHRWLPEATIATLGLARLDAECGREGVPARSRIAELEAAFGSGEMAGLEGLLAALREYPRQIPAGETLQGFTAELGAVCLRLLRLRGVRGAPLPFA